MSLLDRHIAFVEALRGAGLQVSLAEDLDAATALTAIDWDDRSTMREAYAATLVKRQAHRPSFDAVFDLFFPGLVGDGRTARTAEEEEQEGPRDTGPALADFIARLEEALAEGDEALLNELAIEAVARFGSLPGRGQGMSTWSAYSALKRVDPGQLTQQIIDALMAGGMPEDDATRTAGRRVASFQKLAEDDARRRIGE